MIAEMDLLRNQRNHLEVDLIKAKQLLGVPLASDEHDDAKGSPGSG